MFSLVIEAFSILYILNIVTLDAMSVVFFKTNQWIFTIVICSLCFMACKSSNSSIGLESELTTVLDSLQVIYAPDKRVALWNFSIDNKSSRIIVTAEVDNNETAIAINSTLEYRFPTIEFQIDLLPENKNIVSGIVNNSVVNLRSNSRHSAEIATQAVLGTPVKILKSFENWYFVQTPNKYLSWVDTPAVVKFNEKELLQYKQLDKVVFSKSYGFSYSKPDRNSQTVSDLVLGSIIATIGAKDDYINILYPDGRQAWVLKSEVETIDELIGKRHIANDLVTTAMKFMGLPYLWGGMSSKAVDCSGFTSTVFYMNGTIIQRDASQQVKHGKIITTEFIDRDLIKGDLLFFGRKANAENKERITHVAMYIGEGNVIHSSGKVRISSMDPAKENYMSDYVDRFVKAVRVYGEVDKFGIEAITDNIFYKEILNHTD